jgi:hypothetical protein
MTKTLDRKVLRSRPNPLKDMLDEGSKQLARSKKQQLLEEQKQIKPRRKIVSWNDDEKRIFIRVIFEIRLLHPHIRDKELVDEATLRIAKENLLPVDRRRKGSGLYQKYTAGTFDSFLIEMGGVAIDHVRSRTSFETQQKKDPLDSLSDEDVMARFGRRVLDNLPLNEVVSGFTTDELLGMISTPDLAAATAKRMVTDLLQREIRLTQHVRQEVPSPVNGHNGHNGHNGSRINRLVPHVAIVGANSDQYSRLTGQFDGRATFAHIEPRKLDSAALDGADRVVVWGDYCSSQQKRIARNRMKAAKCIENLLIHHGGYNTLVSAMDSLF